MLDLLEAARVPRERVAIDLGLARGLDYYTGIVFETTINGWEKFGSVASGGRYDNLASLFTPRQLPGVGASIGLDRLLALLEEAGKLTSARDDGPGSGRKFPGHEPGGGLQHGGAASSRGHRRRGLSRRDFDRQADGIRLVPRPQTGRDRRAGRRGASRSSTCAISPPARRTRGSPGRSWKIRCKACSRSSSRKGPAHDCSGRRSGRAGRSQPALERPVGLVRGTRDWLPADCARLGALERQLLDGFARAGYEPIRTPILEFTELHERKSGAGIVSKLFELASGGPAAICLRPELTASIVRAFAEARECPALPWRVSSSAPVFRYESDTGSVRLREFTQVGVELLGAGGPAADAEVIALADRSLSAAAGLGRDRSDRPRRADSGDPGAHRAAGCRAGRPWSR